MILTTERQAIKTELLTEAFLAILGSVDQAAGRGDALHTVEGSIFRQLLTLGRQLLEQFVGQQGSGDLGETIRLSDERTVRRLDGLVERTYRSIFGDLTRTRKVYGTPAGQKHELVPLDERLQLPDGAYSHLLQDWAQGFAMELSFAGVQDLLAKVLGVSVPVDSLERMNRTMAEGMTAFRASRPAPSPADEGAVFVVGGDGKGVPMRRALVPVDARRFDELPVPVRDVIERPRPAVAAIGQHRRLATAFPPQVQVVLLISNRHQHDLVIPAEGHEPAAAVQVEQPIEDALGIRPAVHVVAERDDRVVAARVHGREQ